ncbi:hypothetical protein [Bifidobacterium aerophilum]|uniref:Uncharacterized protein n=1 Tax=Bifidobacterium aerophilum TaxID=1798155 RepID=A0A6N9Z3A5_9BIFI|nr:hypothetical protein [Bifidobacterium aerophilum]NEG88991.1 hypothetical protein [Bifidobacterium aerophilum]
MNADQSAGHDMRGRSGAVTPVPLPARGNAARVIGAVLMGAGVIFALAVLAGMAYLRRGVYDPTDVLALLFVCVSVMASPVCLITGVIVSAIAAASGRAHARDRPEPAIRP